MLVVVTLIPLTREKADGLKKYTILSTMRVNWPHGNFIQYI